MYTNIWVGSGREEWCLWKNKILGVINRSKRIRLLFILQKCNQVNEMISYTFLHQRAVTHCSYITSVGKCTSFFVVVVRLNLPSVHGQKQNKKIPKKQKYTPKTNNLSLQPELATLQRASRVPFNSFMAWIKPLSKCLLIWACVVWSLTNTRKCENYAIT